MNTTRFDRICQTVSVLLVLVLALVAWRVTERNRTALKGVIVTTTDWESPGTAATVKDLLAQGAELADCLGDANIIVLPRLNVCTPLTVIASDCTILAEDGDPLFAALKAGRHYRERYPNGGKPPKRFLAIGPAR